MKPFAILLSLVLPLSLVCAQDAKPPVEKAPEAKESKGYAVGAVVADFSLNDLEGKKTSLKSIGEGKKYIVLNFWSRNCPAAQICEPLFVKLNTDYSSKGVAMVHIASNKQENKVEADVTATKTYAKDHKITWPVLLDVDNKIADVFGGQATPHVYVIDVKDMKVVYAGAVTDNDWKPAELKQEHVKEALDLLLAGKPVATSSTKPKGCTIKRVR